MTEKQREYHRAWRARNPEKVRAAQRKYAETHRAERREQVKQYHALNKPRANERMRKWREKHRETYSAYRRRRHKLNINGCRTTKERWNKNNKEKAREYDRKRYAKRRLDRTYLLSCSLRSRINALLRGSRKTSVSAVKFLGCSIADLKIYLESKFEPGMTWENHGRGTGKHKWHVDHIMPCAIFDLSKPEHQKRCFHFSNLQPLFAAENIRKRDKILTNQFQLI